MSTNRAPKRIIFDHYDELINEIDIHTEQLLERFSDDDVLDDHWDISHHKHKSLISEFNYSIETSFTKYRSMRSLEDVPMRDPAMDLKSIKVKNYVQKARTEMLAVIAKKQQENLDFYDQNKDKFSGYREKMEDPEEELKRALFANKFCFLVPTKRVVFGLTLVVTDFYLPKNHLELISADTDPFLPIEIGIELNQEEIWAQLVSKFVSRLRILSNTDLYILELIREQIIQQTCQLAIKNNAPNGRIEIDWLPPNLEYLELNGVKFSKDSFPLLPSLGYLRLNRCDLSELSPDWPNSLPSLHALFSSKSKGISALNTENLSNFAHLSLDISQSLPSFDFLAHLGESLKSLEFVCDNFVGFAHINWSLLSFPNLERLNLGPNFLELDVKNLTRCTIYHNSLKKLQTLPHAQHLLKLFTKTKEMSLSWGFLELKDDFPASFSNLISLDVQVNQITRLDSKFFSCTPNLEILNLHSDKFPRFTCATFSCLPKLKELLIQTRCELDHLESGLFSALTSLENFKLFGCGNSSLSVGVFNGLEHLKNLWIIFLVGSKSVDLNVFLSVPNLQTLSLRVPSDFSLSKSDFCDFMRKRTRIKSLYLNK